MKLHFDWKKFWNSKAFQDPLDSAGRSGSSISDLYIYAHDIINGLGGINKRDVILDVGGGAGYLSMMLSPFVKKIYLSDYSSNMIKKASKNTKSYNNIEVYLDNILDLKKTRRKKIKFSKSIVGSVLQCLNDYQEIENIFKYFYLISNKGTRIIFTHNPDITKKNRFIKSYDKLNWSKKRKKRSIAIERKKRFWINYLRLKKIADMIGYSTCRKLKINKNLFQSSHMFDLLLEK
tara:strand:- start:377 stop:1078 length:702 start_codon:yes stop_codon:yes gene_type:complete